MNFIRFQNPLSETSFGILEGDRVQVISGSPFTEWKARALWYDLSQLRVLSPVERSTQMFALALNDVNSEAPGSNPHVFLKASNSLAGPGDDVVVPSEVDDVKMEAELVAVIGKTAKAVSPAEAKHCILGYTVGNDLTARCWYRGPGSDLQWWRAKGLDTFGPVGPSLRVGLDDQQCEVVGRVNGVERQRFSTSELRFSAPQAVAFISRFATLYPGDVVWLGTAGSAPRVHPGDVVEVEVVGIGTLSNPLVTSR